ncbi:MAG: hypothetical protein ABIQ56_00650 [Chitinophagaceae bacterium]
MKKLIRNIAVFTFLFITMVFHAMSVLSQPPAVFKKSSVINGPFIDFTVDLLGNLYVITPQSNLKKIDINGDSVANYNNVRLFGKPSSVNVTNPLKILLYFQPYATLVVLDRFLNKRNTIDLRKQNIFTVKAVSPSYDNNIWVFDEQDNKLKKVADDGSTLSETLDFRMIFDSVPSPVSIIDRDGFVYLYDPEKGIYVFDYYGAFKSKLMFLKWKDFEVIGKNIYGFDDTHYFVYRTGTLDLKQYPLPLAFKEYSSLKLGNEKVYILKNDQVEIYSLQ